MPKQDLDPTFMPSVFTGVIHIYVQTSKKGGSAVVDGGVSKSDMEKLIGGTAQTGSCTNNPY